MSRRNLLFIFPVLALAQAPDIASRLDEQAQAYAKGGRFNGSVLVARDGKVIFEKGYGMANFEWEIPAAPDTKYRLGSITKQFTGMAIMLLEQDGKLKTSDAVCQYVDPCPERWKPITIHHLLTHTSGIPNFTSFPDYLRTMHQPSPPAESLARFRDRPLDFDSGTKYSYSNSGYVLLGLIIEKAAGTPYADFVQKRIFTPLEMNDSGYDTSAVVLPRRAAGYEMSAKGRVNASYIDMSIPHAAGALYSTVRDLHKWSLALAGNKLLPAEAMARYLQPDKNNYAYGILSIETPLGKLTTHGGGINGFSTDLKFVASKGIAAIALCNAIPCDPARLTNDFVQILAGGNPTKPRTEPRKEISLKREVLAQYVGDYEITPAFVLSVTLEGDQLVTQATGQGKIPVFPESETAFFPKVMEATLTFQKDAEGKVTGLVLDQGGRKTPARKK